MAEKRPGGHYLSYLKDNATDLTVKSYDAGRA